MVSFLFILRFPIVYVEFFNDTKAVEYAYVNPNNIFPLQDKYMPKKPSKRFEKSLEAAKAERESIDSVVQVSD